MKRVLAAVAVLLLWATPAFATEYEVRAEEVPSTPAEAAQEAQEVTEVEAGELVVIEIDGESVVVPTAERAWWKAHPSALSASMRTRQRLPTSSSSGRHRRHRSHDSRKRRILDRARDLG